MWIASFIFIQSCEHNIIRTGSDKKANNKKNAFNVVCNQVRDSQVKLTSRKSRKTRKQILKRARE